MLRTMSVICALGVLLSGPASGWAAAPKKGADAFSDKAVLAAIKKTRDFLWSQQDAKTGAWVSFGKQGANNYHPLGPTALAVYALLESDTSKGGMETLNDPRMVKALKALASLEIDGTYSLGLRANVWLAAMKKDEPKYKALLRKDVLLLVTSTKDGSYGYTCKGDGKSSGDNSNAQYGLLGVWAGAQALLEIPQQYWIRVPTHWINCQSPDGGWDYRGSSASKSTMVAAGVASLFVCYDNLLSGASSFIKCQASPQMALAQKPIERGLGWFDKNFTGSVHGAPHGYYLYGVERVGLASGYKYFGKADWYKLGATQFLRAQQANGSFGGGGHGGALANAAYGLLFLIRGRNTVLFNKLEFEGDWNNRPRDLAALTRWLNKNYEGTVNWQIINLSVPVAEWHDAPILYISGSRKPKFSDEHIKALRTYVQEGGTIFSVTECRGVAFTVEMAAVYKKMFPQYELTAAPENHKLYDAVVPMRTRRNRPRFKIVTNGIRPLIVHCDEDLSKEWQLQNSATSRAAFETAANVYMYFTDLRGSIRARGTTPWPAAPAKFTPKAVCKIARLKYNGNYDPEPLAFTRFALMMAHQYKIRVDVTQPTAIADLAASGAKLATLCGTKAFALTEAEITALKAFVAGGGTLFIEAAGGDLGSSMSTTTTPSQGFAKAAKDAIAKLSTERLSRVRPSSPIYTVPEMEIKTVSWRRATTLTMSVVKTPKLQAVTIDNRPAIIFSDLDISAGLLGTAGLTVHGYRAGTLEEPGSAFEIMRNITILTGKVK